MKNKAGVIKGAMFVTIGSMIAWIIHLAFIFIVHTLMILYAKEEGQINLVLWQGQLLGQLGETPQKDMEIPAEETNDLLSYWYETDLEEEVIC